VGQWASGRERGRGEWVKSKSETLEMFDPRPLPLRYVSERAIECLALCLSLTAWELVLVLAVLLAELVSLAIFCDPIHFHPSI
jgi:hypothetical protein